jgi:hypothetical protein
MIATVGAAWKWLVVAALSATPALLAGQAAGVALGLYWELPLAGILVTAAVSGFLEALAVIRLAQWGETRPRIARWLEHRRTPRALSWAQRFGPWGGLLLGGATVGQEPIIFALIWLRVEPRRLLLPLAFANALYTAVGYYLVKAGWAEFATLAQLWEDLKLLWSLE